MISLFLLAGALYIRWWGGDDEMVTAKLLFALSAPPLFARFLFFAQILRRQGVVIEVSVLYARTCVMQLKIIASKGPIFEPVNYSTRRR